MPAIKVFESLPLQQFPKIAGHFAPGCTVRYGALRKLYGVKEKAGMIDSDQLICYKTGT
jgi:hypothetical protein